MNNILKNKRTSIPDAVKHALREEVGFGCPIEGCGIPYLEYHHFDPPVNIRPHNEPSGMIALCAVHHAKADGGNYTNEQLHALKANKVNSEKVKGDLEWLRNKLLAVVGGNVFYETYRVLVIDEYDVIAFDRDELGYLRLTVNLLSLLPEERLVIKSHSWENIGNATDLRCPPQGKELEIKYANGDYLHLRFLVIKNLADAEKRYKKNMVEKYRDDFPMTAIEINMAIGGTNVHLTPTGSTIGKMRISDSVLSSPGIGIYCSKTGMEWRQNENGIAT